MADLPTLSQLPMLTFDELTVLRAALDRLDLEMADVGAVAVSDTITGLSGHVRQIVGSLQTAVAEARYRCHRPTGGPLEPFREAWDDPVTARRGG